MVIANETLLRYTTVMILAKRAIGIASLLYIATFIVGIASAIGLGIDLSETPVAPDIVWVIGFFASIALMSIAARWYFAAPDTQPSIKTGALFGASCIGIGFVFEFLLIIPWILTTESPADIAAYYGNPWFLWTMIALVVTSAIVGAQKSDDGGTIHLVHTVTREE